MIKVLLLLNLKNWCNQINILKGTKFDISHVQLIIAHVKEDDLALEDLTKATAKIIRSVDIWRFKGNHRRQENFC